MGSVNGRPDKCLTYKQSAFCHGIVEGLSQTEAYRAAYPGTKMSTKTMKEAASRLMRVSNVIATIEELKAPAVEKVKRSYEKWLQEVENVAFVPSAQLEVKTPDTLKALELYGKATGLHKSVSPRPSPPAGGQLSALTYSGLPSLAGRRVCMRDCDTLRQTRRIFLPAHSLDNSRGCL